MGWVSRGRCWASTRMSSHLPALLPPQLSPAVCTVLAGTPGLGRAKSSLARHPLDRVCWALADGSQRGPRGLRCWPEPQTSGLEGTPDGAVGTGVGRGRLPSSQLCLQLRSDLSPHWEAVSGLALATGSTVPSRHPGPFPWGTPCPGPSAGLCPLSPSLSRTLPQAAGSKHQGISSPEPVPKMHSSDLPQHPARSQDGPQQRGDRL